MSEPKVEEAGIAREGSRVRQLRRTRWIWVFLMAAVLVPFRIVYMIVEVGEFSKECWDELDRRAGR